MSEEKFQVGIDNKPVPVVKLLFEKVEQMEKKLEDQREEYWELLDKRVKTLQGTQQNILKRVRELEHWFHTGEYK